MNDRFKFRFYDKKTNKMMYEDSNFNEYNKEEWWGYEEEMALNALKDTFLDYSEHYTLMQCTGLKDKNGKLIYEGDIVKFKDVYNTYRQGTIKYTNEDALFCLSYIDKSNKKDWDFVSHYKLEVIGNIYENKELLE